MIFVLRPIISWVVAFGQISWVITFGKTNAWIFFSNPKFTKFVKMNLRTKFSRFCPLAYNFMSNIAFGQNSWTPTFWEKMHDYFSHIQNFMSISLGIIALKVHEYSWVMSLQPKYFFSYPKFHKYQHWAHCVQNSRIFSLWPKKNLWFLAFGFRELCSLWLELLSN